MHLGSVYRQVMRHVGKAARRPCWMFTCLKHGGSVGGALTVVRDGCDLDQVLLTTFEHRDLAASRGGRAVEGHASAIDGRGSVQVGSEHQIPSYCHHATGAAVVHRHSCHRVYGCVNNKLKM